MSGLASRQRAARKFRSNAERMLAREDAGIAFDFTDESFQSSNERWGSVFVKDNVTLANNAHTTPFDLLTYTSPSNKMTLGPRGILQFRPHNLLLRSSETSDNSYWTRNAVSFTANAIVAPDNTLTADLMLEVASTSGHFIYPGVGVATAAAEYRFTVFVKQYTRRYAQVFLNEVGDHGVTVDLQTGSVAATIGTITSSAILDAGNGWYKVTVVKTLNASTWYPAIGIATSAATSRDSYLGVITEGLYVWGAQLARNPSPDIYVPTTSAARYGLPFEWDTTGKLLGLLVEEARTNTSQRSQELANSYHTKGAAGVGSTPTATANFAVAPDGTTTATRLQFALNGGTASADRSAFGYIGSGSDAAPIDNVTRTKSIWLKSNTASSYTMTYRLNGTEIFIVVTPTWQRFSVTGASSSDASNLLELRGARSTVNSDSADILAWGLQIETGSFASSYIPTVAASVTRVGDNINALLSAFPYSATEGTMIVQARAQPTSGSLEFFVQLSDNSTAESIQFYRTGSNLNAQIVDGGVSLMDQSFVSTVPNSQRFAAAFAWAANDGAASVNNSAVGTDTSFTLPTLTTTHFGSRLGGGRHINGYLEKVVLLPRRMANADLREAARLA